MLLGTQKDKRTKPVNLPKSSAFWKSGSFYKKELSLFGGQSLASHLGDPGSISRESNKIYGEKSDTGTVFVWVFRFTPVGIIPPMFHTHHLLHVAFTIRTNGLSLGTFQKKKNALSDIGENQIDWYFESLKFQN